MFGCRIKLRFFIHFAEFVAFVHFRFLFRAVLHQAFFFCNDLVLLYRTTLISSVRFHKSNKVLLSR